MRTVLLLALVLSATANAAEKNRQPAAGIDGLTIQTTAQYKFMYSRTFDKTTGVVCYAIAAPGGGLSGTAISCVKVDKLPEE